MGIRSSALRMALLTTSALRAQPPGLGSALIPAAWRAALVAPFFLTPALWLLPAHAQVIDYPNGTNSPTPLTISSNTLQLQVLTGGATQSGVISGDQAGRPLEKIGSGTLVLTAANTYTGTTIIRGGTVALGNVGALGAGTGLIALSGGALRLDVNGTIANSIRVDTGNNGDITAAAGRTATLTGDLVLSANSGLNLGSATDTGTITTSFNTVTTAVAVGALRIDGGTVINGNGSLALLTERLASTTIAAGATLDLAGNAPTPSFAVNNLRGNGTLTNTNTTFIRSGVFEGVITGTTGIEKIGTGVLTLSGANTYSGTTTITAGLLIIGTGGTTGTLGTGAVVNNGALLVNRSDLIPVANDISGTGSVFQAGGGTLVLTGNNIYSGGTNISAGTLQVGDGGSTGTLGTGSVTNDAALVFNRSDTITVSNAISGIGTLTQAGGGTTILTGTNTYAGTTTITAGTLQVGAGGIIGTLGSGNVVNNAVLAFNRSNTITVAYAISGTGSFTQAGPGTLMLTGTNTYTGITTITGGTLQIGDGGATGTIGSGNIVNNASLNVNRTTDMTLGQVISGSGVLIQAGPNNLTLSGVNTYTGGTVLNNGTVTVAADTALGDAAGELFFNGGRLTTTANVTANRATTLDAGGGILAPAAATTLTMSGVITGTGALTMAGAGTLVLTGANNHTGDITINTGTLQIGDGGTTGTLGSGAVVNDASLTFNRSNVMTVGNAISGTGLVRQSGPGGTILTGALSHTGGTFVDAGTLVLGNVGNSVTLPGAATVAAGATLGVENGSLGSGTVGNAGNLGISFAATAGSAIINNALTGNIVLSGTATAGTARINNLGQVIFSGDSTAGNATIINDCCLFFSGNATAGNAIITNNATRSLDFFNDSTAASATINNAGFIRFLNNATGGMAAYTGAAGSTLDLSFLAAPGLTLGSLAGTGSVALGSAALAVGGNGASTTFAGVIADGGVLGGVGASLLKVGSGTLTLTGTNTYTGGTAINAGAISIAADGALGPVAGRLTFGGGTLATTASLTSARAVTLNAGGGGFAPAAGTALTLTNVISGTGGLSQNGAGNLILTGSNTYTGGTVVNSGTLSVNGSIASSSGVTVNGGTLGGNGQFPNVLIGSGGSIGPGNSVGTMNIAGNLTLAAGSTTTIEVQGSMIDRINVTGSATLGGSLQLLALGGTYNFSTPYTIIQAGSIAGGFSALTTTGSFGAGISPTVTTGATQVLLTLAPAILVPTPTPTSTPTSTPTPTPTPTPTSTPTPTPATAPVTPTPEMVSAGVVAPVLTVAAPGIPGFLTYNLRAAASALDAANRAGANLTPFMNIYNQPGSRIGLAVNQLSGEVATSLPAMGFAAGEQFLATVLDPMGMGRESLMGRRLRAGAPGDGQDAAPGQKRHAVWGAATGAYNRTTGDAANGSASRTTRSAGFALGFDYLIGAQSMVGVAIAVGESSANLASGQGSARANFGQIGAYGTTRLGSVTLAAAGAVTLMDIDTRRTLYFLGNDRQNGGAGAQVYSFRAEALQDGIAVAGFRLQPVAALQVQVMNNQGYTESSTVTGQTNGLTVAGQSNTSLRTELGAQAQGSVQLGTRSVQGFARLAWAHYLVRDASMGVGFASLSNAGFTVRGARPDANAALISAGIQTEIMPGLTLSARIDSEFSGNVAQVAGTARLRYAF